MSVSPSRRRGKSGQTMIFLIMILIILTFVALWNFDLHKIIYVKSLSQNAGDAAALAAARWQGITLNLIGDLNIMQAVALTDGRTNEAAEIAGMQARLCYVGPMIGCMAAQQAAKNNGVFNNAGFKDDTLLPDAEMVRIKYPTEYPVQPYPDAWNEYADMIEAICADGVAALPYNPHYYQNYVGSHTLLDPEFYDAVVGQDWCWFLHNAMDLLQNFDRWPDLPERRATLEPMNSEYFDLGLRKVVHAMDADDIERMAGPAYDRALTGRVDHVSVNAYTVSWYCYDGSWGPWEKISTEAPVRFPATGEVLPQYDYAGADAAIRVETEVSRYTPGASDSPIIWTAAAKPFGYLNDTERPNAYDLVLPAFHDVRLIPVDASSTPVQGGEPNWRVHIDEHLPLYMQNGRTGLFPGECWYCRQLVTWESTAFRQMGIDWLAQYSALCRSYGSGGAHGGSQRGH